MIEPYKPGQLVRVVQHANVGEVGQIAHQRGTTDDCGLPEPCQPIYMVGLMGMREPWGYKHSELEAVEVVTAGRKESE